MLAELGCTLVRVRFAGRYRPTLQVMAERADGQPVTLGDCTRISRRLSPVLEARDPVAGAWVLEVTSTGIERPLVRRADFDRFAGQRVALKAHQPIAGRRRFHGRLVGLLGDAVVIEADDGTHRLPLDALAEIHLDATAALAPARRTPRRH
ncbi:MAG: ribosome maturation factor RimP [Alphaproteobacteria bacterium]